MDAADPRVDRMARLVVERMLRLRAGQSLVLGGAAIAQPLFVAVAGRAAAAGASVLVQARPEGVERAVLEHASEATLERPDTLRQLAWERADALVEIRAALHPRDLEGIPAAKLAAVLRGRRGASEAQFRRSAAGELRWAVVLHPSPGDAAEAGMPLPAFADLVYSAARCDDEDPVAAWERQEARQAVLRARLEGGSELRLRAPGTDLTLRIAGRTWRSSSALRNLPDGEVFTAPHETSAEGEVSFTYPAIRTGRRVEGVRLVFREGRVAEATAEAGEDVLQATIASDEGASRLGEVGLGTNERLTRFTANTLLDEKIGGTFHLALGRAYPETGGTNVSALHWDLVCDLRQGGEIVLDGEAIQRDGRFLPGTGLE